VWNYDEDHARIREVRTIPSGVSAGTRTTWYLHPDNTGGLAFESEVNAPTSPSAVNPAVTSNRHYLSAGGQSLGVLVTTGALPVLGSTQTAPPVQSSLSAVKLEYWHKDHLGSIAATTDHNGDVTARDAYDPFGKRRFANGNYDAAGALVIDWSPAANSGTDRGFTGHEQLDDIGLTHMNGRLYDANIGRFLSVDKSVTDPNQLQAYNRYSYVRNDPLARVDPSGWADFEDKTWEPEIYVLPEREIRGVAPALPPVNLTCTSSCMGGLFRAGPGFALMAAPGTPVQKSFQQGLSAGAAKTTRVVGGIRAYAHKEAENGSVLWKMIDAVLSVGDSEEQATDGLSTESEKRPPNPNGRKGSPEHQAEVGKAEQELRDKYANDPNIEVQTEVRVRTPGGDKENRYLDVAAVDKRTGEVVEGVQVGKQTQAGNPVAREQRAIQDVNKASPGTDVSFRPYNR
jgi:RHS repeat-associated protein